jgi:hypothetical protein
MPLQPGEPERVLKRLKPIRQDFGTAFLELVGNQLEDVDGQLVDDVDNMGAFRTLAPLPDADRVILRNRLIWLLADHSKIRGNLQVPGTWTLLATIDALRGFDGQEARCPRSETEIKLLSALAEHYADQVVRTRLTPKIGQWIEGVANDMLDAVRLPREEFSAEIRKAPFKTFQ